MKLKHHTKAISINNQIELCYIKIYYTPSKSDMYTIITDKIYYTILKPLQATRNLINHLPFHHSTKSIYYNLLNREIVIFTFKTHDNKKILAICKLIK
jgi:hypothetical protein